MLVLPLILRPAVGLIVSVTLILSPLDGAPSSIARLEPVLSVRSLRVKVPTLAPGAIVPPLLVTGAVIVPVPPSVAPLATVTPLVAVSDPLSRLVPLLTHVLPL